MNLKTARHTLSGFRQEAASLTRVLTPRHPASQPEGRFIVFGRGRSGSTLLVRLLNSHPEITCLGELLNRPRMAPISYVERELRHRSGSRRGFKLLSYQVRDIAGGRRVERFRDWIVGSGMTVIHMQRENFLRQAVSRIYAREREAFHSTDTGARSHKTITVDLDQILDYMKRSDDLCRWEADFLADLPRTVVTYETDLATPDQQQNTVDRLCDVLGVPPQQVEASLKPVTPRDYTSFIANWDEIAEGLADTPFARFLDS